MSLSHWYYFQNSSSCLFNWLKFKCLDNRNTTTWATALWRIPLRPSGFSCPVYYSIIQYLLKNIPFSLTLMIYLLFMHLRWKNRLFFNLLNVLHKYLGKLWTCENPILRITMSVDLRSLTDNILYGKVPIKLFKTLP